MFEYRRINKLPDKQNNKKAIIETIPKSKATFFMIAIFIIHFNYMTAKIPIALILLLAIIEIGEGVFVSKMVEGQSQLCFSDDIRNNWIRKQGIP